VVADSWQLTSPHENDHGLARNLTGNLIRSAQSIGLHREGSGSGISPFEVEIRRRLWWNICALDCRTSEDHGIEHMIPDTNVALPSNLNDADLHPSMTNTPTPSKTATDTTFCLIKFQLARMLGQMKLANSKRADVSPAHLEARTAAIKETEDAILAACLGNGPPPDLPQSRQDCKLAGETIMKLTSVSFEVPKIRRDSHTSRTKPGFSSTIHFD
jgi:hypothetical protein